MSLVWRSLYGGDIRHAVKRVPNAASMRGLSVCGIRRHVNDWYGAAVEERDDVMAMPACRRCRSYLEVDGSRVETEETVLTPAAFVAAVRGRYSGVHR